MMSFMLGKKAGMTQLFLEDGSAVPVTVIEAGPLTVVQIKTVEHDGYNAVKVAYGDVKEARVNKPEKGLFAKAELTPKKYVREFRVDATDGYNIGDVITVESLKEGSLIDVVGTSKGKGFQGTTKRYGNSKGPMSHGSKYHRGLGALAMGSSPGRVPKGRHMPGHMGEDRVTVQNLEVMKIYGDRNAVLVKGAVPGPKGGLIMIQDAKNV